MSRIERSSFDAAAKKRIFPEPFRPLRIKGCEELGAKIVPLGAIINDGQP